MVDDTNAGRAPNFAAPHNRPAIANLIHVNGPDRLPQASHGRPPLRSQQVPLAQMPSQCTPYLKKSQPRRISKGGNGQIKEQTFDLRAHASKNPDSKLNLLVHPALINAEQGDAILQSLRTIPMPLGATFLLTGQHVITAIDREYQVDWLGQLCAYFGFRIQTFALAVRLVDEILALGCTSRQDLSLQSAVCLFIAMKMEETTPISIRALANVIVLGSQNRCAKAKRVRRPALRSAVIGANGGGGCVRKSVETEVIDVDAEPDKATGSRFGVSDRSRKRKIEHVEGSGRPQDADAVRMSTACTFDEEATNTVRTILKVEMRTLAKLGYHTCKQTPCGIVEWVAFEAAKVYGEGVMNAKMAVRLGECAQFAILVWIRDSKVAALSSAAVTVAAVRVALCVEGLDARGVSKWGDIEDLAEAVTALVGAWQYTRGCEKSRGALRIFSVDLRGPVAELFKSREAALEALFDDVREDAHRVQRVSALVDDLASPCTDDGKQWNGEDVSEVVLGEEPKGKRGCRREEGRKGWDG